MNTEVICPYCEHGNHYELELTRYFKKEIFTCDLEEGGCDRDFIVRWIWRPETQVKKIEGEY